MVDSKKMKRIEEEKGDERTSLSLIFLNIRRTGIS
jgi:hypothetical protein